MMGLERSKTSRLVEVINKMMKYTENIVQHVGFTYKIIERCMVNKKKKKKAKFLHLNFPFYALEMLKTHPPPPPSLPLLLYLSFLPCGFGVL